MSPGEKTTWIIVTDGPATSVPLPDGRLVTLTPDAPSVDALNLVTDVVARDLVGTEPSAAPGAAEIVEDPDHGRRRLLDEYRAEFGWEFLRPDGSVALRTPAGSLGGRTEVRDPQGRIVMGGHGLGDVWRWWIELIAPGVDPVVIVSTSPTVSAELSRLDDRFVVVHVWSEESIAAVTTMTSPIDPDLAMLVRGLDRLDAVVAPPESVELLQARFGDAAHWHTAGDEARFWDDVVESALARQAHRARLDGVRHRFEKNEIVVTVLGEGELDEVRVRWESYAPDATAVADRTNEVERDGREFRVRIDRRGIVPSDVQRLSVVWRNATWTSEITPPRSTWTTIRRVFSWSAGPSIGELRAQHRALREAERGLPMDQAGEASVESSSSSDDGI